MQSNQTLIRKQDSVLSYHSVLRNTYLLLSLTLLFSAATAAYAVISGATYGTSALFSLIFGIGLLFVTTALRNSAWGILAIFAFTGFMGYSMGPFLNHFIHGYKNGAHLVLTALGGTGLTFFACSAYALTTKKELSHLGKMLMIGLIVCIVAALANIFLKMPALQLTISALLVFISSMLIMYDTSRIIHNGETNYIMATISLYLDILVLFQNLLILLGAFGGSRD
ncbi:hypothetical protein AYO45_03870 [Gammaproteobacteria bacterium SCGC AG-212-F23]|nr:hypothetical protein AYO45_03870 [Gammaproteobacteria bacterium SCGC AG-212-F23]